MAAPLVKMVLEDSSSSSDDEELKKCREAVWETQVDTAKDGDINVKASKRVIAAAHEHDGNELQVTKGFQTHVAKKLEHFLDGCISEMQNKTSDCLEAVSCSAAAAADDDGGFRLFSTSIPQQEVDDPPAPVRRRPLPSSSDSDSEMETRLKEAAVSVKDLLPSSAFLSTVSPPSSQPHNSEKTKKMKDAEEEERCIVKKKKKKKQNIGENSAHDQSNGEHGRLEQEHVKRKKKKKKKGNTEEEALS